MTYEALLKLALKKAVSYHKEEEAVKLLLMELSGQDAHHFYLNIKNEIDTDLEQTFLYHLEQYVLKDIPVQHLIGHSYFFGHKFLVNSNVLIPRSETEQLVEHVLFYYDTYFELTHATILDLGTGSGCIGLTLALEDQSMDVTISDISQKALDVAERNKVQLGAKANSILSNLFDHIQGTYDIIVSNPPYIPDKEIVENIVQKEPSVALYGGHDGIDFYEKILRDAKKYLNKRALIAFEHGYQQKERIYDFAQMYYPDAVIVQIKDLQGKDRFTFIGLGGVLDRE